MPTPVQMLLDPVSLTELNPFVAAGIGVLVYELLIYVWHRNMHRVDWQWCSFHQMHHSAERLDSYGKQFRSYPNQEGTP